MHSVLHRFWCKLILNMYNVDIFCTLIILSLDEQLLYSLGNVLFCTLIDWAPIIKSRTENLSCHILSISRTLYLLILLYIFLMSSILAVSYLWEVIGINHFYPSYGSISKTCLIKPLISQKNKFLQSEILVLNKKGW